MKFTKLAVLGLVAAISSTAFADAPAADPVAKAIKFRQSGYQFLAWNSGRIKDALAAPQYDKDEVIKAANAIQAIANSGMGKLFVAGSDKGKGWKETEVKADLFTKGDRVKEVAGNFAKEANELAKVAATGDAKAVKVQYGKLTESCKACHKDFKKD